MFADGTGLLPMAFDTAKGKINGEGISSRIVRQHFEHPALEYVGLFADVHDPCPGGFTHPSESRADARTRAEIAFRNDGPQKSTAFQIWGRLD